ncbi:MAG: hypothetical protein AAF639_31240 [Chloroflexota bacterium]
MTIEQRVQRKHPTRLDEQTYSRLSQSEMPKTDTPSNGEVHHTGAIQRASLDPSTLTPQDAQVLQRTIGNAQLTTLLQNHKAGGDSSASSQRTSAPTQINFERSIQRMAEHVDSLVAQGEQLTAQSQQHRQSKNTATVPEQVQRTDIVQRTGGTGATDAIIQRTGVVTFTNAFGKTFTQRVTTFLEMKNWRRGGKARKDGTTYDQILTKLHALHDKKSYGSYKDSENAITEITGLISTWVRKHPVKYYFNPLRSSALMTLDQQLSRALGILHTSWELERERRRMQIVEERLQMPDNKQQVTEKHVGRPRIGPDLSKLRSRVEPGMVEPGAPMSSVKMHNDAPIGSQVIKPHDLSGLDKRGSEGDGNETTTGFPGLGKILKNMIQINDELDDDVVHEMETDSGLEKIPIDQMQPGMPVDVDMIDNEDEGGQTTTGPSLQKILDHMLSKTPGGDDDVSDELDDDAPVAFGSNMINTHDIGYTIGMLQGGEKDHPIGELDDVDIYDPVDGDRETRYDED